MTEADGRNRLVAGLADRRSWTLHAELETMATTLAPTIGVIASESVLPTPIRQP